jgi:hypothetical protein
MRQREHVSHADGLHGIVEGRLTEGFLLFFHLFQTARHLDRVLWAGREKIGITRLARNQDSDLGQAKFFPIVLVDE